MSVRYILNGEYRTGTTILYKIIKDSNPSVIPIYEPTVYIMPDHFKRILQENRRGTNLHGFDPYEYLTLLNIDELKILEDLYNNLKWDFSKLFNPKIVIEFIKALNEEGKRDYFIQPNNWHFILASVSNKFNIPYTHIIRNPIDQWISYVKPTVKTPPDITLQIMKNGIDNPRFKEMFFLWVEYPAIAKRFGIQTEERDVFGQFLIYYTICNLYAYIQSENNELAQIIYYEDLCTDPKETLVKIAHHSKLPILLNLSKQIYSHDLYNYSHSFAKVTYERLKELGLLEFIKIFLPKHIYNRTFML